MPEDYFDSRCIHGSPKARKKRVDGWIMDVAKTRRAKDVIKQSQSINDIEASHSRNSVSPIFFPHPCPTQHQERDAQNNTVCEGSCPSLFHTQTCIVSLVSSPLNHPPNILDRIKSRTH